MRRSAFRGRLFLLFVRFGLSVVGVAVDETRIDGHPLHIDDTRISRQRSCANGFDDTIAHNKRSTFNHLAGRWDDSRVRQRKDSRCILAQSFGRRGLRKRCKMERQNTERDECTEGSSHTDSFIQ